MNTMTIKNVKTGMETMKKEETRIKRTFFRGTERFNKEMAAVLGAYEFLKEELTRLVDNDLEIVEAIENMITEKVRLLFLEEDRAMMKRLIEAAARITDSKKVTEDITEQLTDNRKVIEIKTEVVQAPAAATTAVIDDVVNDYIEQKEFNTEIEALEAAIDTADNYMFSGTKDKKNKILEQAASNAKNLAEACKTINKLLQIQSSDRNIKQYYQIKNNKLIVEELKNSKAA